jgi:hypothetical protein
LLEEQAEREIWHLVERYRECKEESIERPTPAQMRKAMGELLKIARSWEKTRELPGRRHALHGVFREMGLHPELALIPSGSKIRTDEPAEVLQLLLDEFSRATREQAPAAENWTGKGWRGKSTPPSLEPEDPNFLLIRGSYDLLGACGKPHAISRNGPVVRLARSIWKLANPYRNQKAPHFKNQIDKLNRFRVQRARKGKVDQTQARRDLENFLQHGIDRLIQSYRKISSSSH